LIRSKYNINFLPEDFQNYILGKIKSESIHFRISAPRKSKLGDYKYNYHQKSHSISINIDLSEVQFLITFIHELAHKKCFERYSNRVASHGKEWKTIFVELLSQARGQLMLTKDSEAIFTRNILEPKATFTKLDKREENDVLVLDLDIESKFELRSGRRFQLIKKRRTRYLCADLNNGQLYTVLGITPIKRLI
tara:strand:- start:233 stop:811 length:579 start_codon:yes stop_codon:yes gene_type:complete